MSTERSNRRAGEWITHSTLRTLHESWWVTFRVDDVERPDGSHTEHEIIVGNDAAGVVVLDDQRGVLMIYRHRFMPDLWGWEVPAGAVDPGEAPEAAARRECEEETGWSPTGSLSFLSKYHPTVGFVSQKFTVYLAIGAECNGPPLDANEAVLVEWRSFETVADDLVNGRICDGFSHVGLINAFILTDRATLIADALRARGEKDS